MAQAEKKESYICGKTVFRLHTGSGFYFSEDTREEVADAVTRAHVNGWRVRVFMGDVKTGEVWPDEWGTMGKVGASCGPCRVPLLVSNARSMGGGSILTGCIVGLTRIDSGRVEMIYRHPSFNPGEWSARECVDISGYMSEALHNGKVHARFKQKERASVYCAFMRGERNRTF